MLINKKTIFRRLLSAFIFIIILSVLLSTAIEYMITKSELPRLLTEIRTRDISQLLSTAYTKDKGWENLNQNIKKMDIDENSDSSLRIVIRNSNGKTLFNSFSDLVQLKRVPLIVGNTIPIYDLDSLEPVGNVTIYISREYLERETGKYIFSIFKTRILQGLISIIVLLFLAAFLSRRISNPIIALTRAAKSIAQSGETSLLSVKSSDELGQLSDAFNKMVLSLQTQRDLRKRLISDLSHEINTPLSVIRLESTSLKNYMISSEIASERIIEEIDKLSNLVHDLDWLAETDAGEFKLKRESCSIGNLLSDEVERWQLKADLAKISLDLLPLPSDLPIMYIDILRISQVLGNLIDNGLKYTPENGKLSVECRVEKEWVKISVSDNGSGIADKDLPYLFERFYRVNHPGMGDKGGRGLGLSIVKQIVELHGGEIRVESSEGIGSRFYFSLPYSPSFFYP